MTRRLHRKQTSAAGLISLLLIYFVALRAFIPSDFMLDRDDATGRLAITICTGYSASHSLFNPQTGALTGAAGGGQLPDGHAIPSHAASCPFALAALPALPVAGIEVPLPPTAGRVVHRADALVAAFPAAIRPPLPARGPPISV